MILPTGNARPAAESRGGPRTPTRPRAFTLVELILVMALLGAVLGAAAPALGRFFKGRTLNSEARRFLSLTLYAQTRAVAEGIPMVLWIDAETRAYGLRAETSYTTEDTRAVEFNMAESIVIEPDRRQPISTPFTPLSRQTAILTRNQPALRFTPEGFIAPPSPERIIIREANAEIWIGLSRNRLHYEIQDLSSTAATR